MTLLEIVRNLDAYDEERTIYAAEPWAAGAQAVVAFESGSGELQDEARDLDLRYFLEVFIARDVLEGYADGRSPEEKCARLIRYAIADA